MAAHHDAVVSLQGGQLSLQVRQLLPELLVVGHDGLGPQQQPLRGQRRDAQLRGGGWTVESFWTISNYMYILKAQN